jgi:riboflavin kinase / FMN adenylyltransferase
MLVSADNLAINLEKRPYIILGNFDGIHLGHRKLINKACSLAKENDAISMIYTFRSHPLSLINKCTAPKLLMDNERRLSLFESLGIDAVKFENFDEAMMKTSPEDFIKNLVYKYNPIGIIVGFNFRFGYKNSGSIDSIKNLENKYNYKLYVINAVKIGDNIVSSSLIRSFIKKGDLISANNFLGSTFSIQGKVIHGNKIGRQLDFPTVNLNYADCIVPGTGVYYTNVLYKSVLYKGITDVGYNPTVSEKSLIKMETHILDFDQDIYDDYIRIFFVKKTRDEFKFDSLNGLKNQLILDKQAAQKEDFIDI